MSEATNDDEHKTNDSIDNSRSNEFVQRLGGLWGMVGMATVGAGLYLSFYVVSFHCSGNAGRNAVSLTVFRIIDEDVVASRAALWYTPSMNQENQSRCRKVLVGGRAKNNSRIDEHEAKEDCDRAIHAE
ncbi:MAG: hypothetical protein ACR2OA_21850 [Rubripirellula sp.]